MRSSAPDNARTPIQTSGGKNANDLVKGVFFLLVIEFGVVYWSLQQINSESLSFLPASFSSCLSYSLTVQTTAPVSNVIPNCPLARIVYTTQLGFTFLLISVFFAMFSTALGFHAPGATKEVESLASTIRELCTARIETFTADLSEPMPGVGAEDKEGTIALANEVVRRIKAAARTVDPNG